MEFEFIAGNPALDFTNTVHCHGSADPRDDLRSLGDLLDWGRQAGVLLTRECRDLLRQAAHSRAWFLQDMLDLREVLYQLFSSLAQHGKARQEALDRFNTSVRKAMAEVLVQGRGKTYAIGWEHLDPASRMQHELVRAALDLLTSPQHERIRQCAGEDCSWLFLDTSHNGTRRWCDMRACGNRAKVRRFRRRAAGSVEMKAAQIQRSAG